MFSLIETGLTNAVLVIPLALIVYCVTRLWRNPHAAHLLWLLVLIKFMTPPVLEIPVPLPASGSVDDSATAGPFSNEVDGADGVPVVVHDEPTAAEMIAGDQTVPATGPIGSVLQTHPDAVPDRTGMATIAARPWQVWVFAGWLAGSIGLMAIVALRVLRFQGLLKHAAPASERLLAMASETASELSVRRVPRLLVMSARVPPLLWPVGRRPTIVLPSNLIGKLSESQLRHVLAHEMAHVARRDHWVRWFEMAVATLFWWHPVFWLTGRGLRAAEEACCDALVVRRCGSTIARQYAGTLLEIVEFVTATTAPPPALGSGIGGQTQLKRRIEMLLEDRVPSRLSMLARLSLMLAAIAVLPLSAVAWQVEKQTDPTPPLDNTPPPVEKLEPDEPRSVRGMRVVIELPEAPYRIAAGDLLQIELPKNNSLPDAPIQGLYLVEPSGELQLGRSYGRMPVQGLTLEEAEAAIAQYLSEYIREPLVAVTMGGWRDGKRQKLAPIPTKPPYRIVPGDLLEIAAPRHTTLPDGPIEGLYLVEPSGKVHLGAPYGRLRLQDLTLEEAEEKINAYLANLIISPQATVTLGGWKLALEQNGKPVAATTGGLDEELVAALREYVEFVEMNHQKTQLMYKVGHAPQSQVLLSEYELSAARAELAQAEGSLEEALNHRRRAREAAEASVKSLETMRASAEVTDDQLVIKAANNLLQAKIQLIAAKRLLTLADGDLIVPRP